MVYFGGFFSQSWTFRGVFSISNNAVRISAAAMRGAGDIILIKKEYNKKKLERTLGPILRFFAGVSSDRVQHSSFECSIA